MQKLFLAGLVLVAGCSPAAEAGGRAEFEPGSYELKNGHWYDGSDFVDTTFYVADGKLVAGRLPRVDSTVDLRGGFVVPPFGEAHTHRPSAPEYAQDGIDRFMASGIFYVMNHGSLARHHLEFQRLTGHPRSIDAVFANALIASSQSHGVELWQRLIAGPAFSEVRPGELDGDAYFIVQSSEDLARLWPGILATDPDFIKVMIENSEEFESWKSDPSHFGESGLDPSLIPGIVSRAHGAGLRVAAHIETGADFHIAVESGVDIVSHLPGYDIGEDEDLDRFRVDPGDAIAAARLGIVVITTTMLSVDRAGDDTFRLQRMQQVQRDNLELLSDAGVGIAAGSDQFSTNAVDEILNLASLGVFDRHTLLDILCTRTPQAIFPQRNLGVLADGAEASFLVLESNPLDDLEAIRDIRLRVKDGLILEPF